MVEGLDANTLAALSLHEDEYLYVQVGQTKHRIALINFWNIKPGDKVLELGCGQGDTTVVLAAAVGDAGHVTAVDPGALDYGSPFNLGQAQSHIAQGALGARVTFVQADPCAHLQAADTDTVYDVAVLAHCIWYFAAPAVLRETLRLLAPRAKRICIAEYALTAARPTAAAHVLAALTYAALECRRAESTANIRTVLSPDGIKEIAAAVGLKVGREVVQVPPDDMYDGRWEVGAVLQDKFLEKIEKYVVDEREKQVVIAMRDAVRLNRAALALEGKKVDTMDVWVADFSV